MAKWDTMRVELLAEFQAVATTAEEEGAVNILEEMTMDTGLEQPPSDGGGTHLDAGNELPEFAHIDADADDMVGADNAEVAKGDKVEGGVETMGAGGTKRPRDEDEPAADKRPCTREDSRPEDDDV